MDGSRAQRSVEEVRSERAPPREGVFVCAVTVAVVVAAAVMVVAAMRGRSEVEQSTKLSVWASHLWSVIPSSSLDDRLGH